MEDIEFSDAFCRFVQTQVPSVDAAEALVALYHSGDAALDRRRQEYRSAGWSDADIKQHLAILAQAWEQRPVTLVRLIYALRDSKIRSFADAFNLRRK